MERVASVMLVGDGDVIELDEFRALVEYYRPRIFRFLLASVRDRDDADMLTQETFLKAYHARSRFRGEASVNTWLMQIAVNALRDHTRNRRWQFWRRTAQDIDAAELSNSLPARGASPEAHAIAKQQVAEVWRAASQLPPKQRTVFLLRFVEDMDILEIATATGSAEGTVKAQLFQALKTIRERLARTR